MFNDYIVSCLSIESSSKIVMGHHISITFNHTLNINNIIKNEYWGGYNKLYYYIDYTFRSRYYNNYIKIYKFKNNNNNNNNSNTIGIYSLNLFKKDDINNKHPLYLVFKPNINGYNKQRKWSVHYEYDKVNEYCMTAQEITKKYGIKSDDIPVFKGFGYPKINYNSISNFNWTYLLKIALNKKLSGNTKDMIYSRFKANGITLPKNYLLQCLAKPFHFAFETAILKDKIIGNTILPGLYFNNNGYDIVYEVLLEVRLANHPDMSDVITPFVFVMDTNYNFVKIINFEMASKNARLIGELPEQWQNQLKLEVNSYSKNDTKKKSNKVNNV